ncbi:hypothetical protein BK010_07475 [Tenericutes bacterium MO-XQ]|nr:hypothetical protein BK010_07475 [Tenericutes bacterium MO-XQ]
MENRVGQVFDKDTSFKTLEIVNSWITAADNKSSILLAFLGLIIGFSADTYGKLADLIVHGSTLQITLIIVFGIIYVIALGFTIFHLISVFIARTNKVDYFSENLVSFVSIANMESTDYINSAKKANEDTLSEMILSQININSKIAKGKMTHFNNALKFGLALIPLTILLMIVAG